MWIDTAACIALQLVMKSHAQMLCNGSSSAVRCRLEMPGNFKLGMWYVKGELGRHRVTLVVISTLGCEFDTDQAVGNKA